MNPSTSVAAAIPAFQAEETVGDVVRGTLELVAEVLVVDDGSTDSTSSAACTMGARVVRHRRNLGKGSALRTAFTDLLARGFSTVITLDADGQHLPGEIPRLLEGARGGADLVLGSRTHLFAEMHPLRRASNRGSSWAISCIAGTAVLDAQSGFRLYTRNLLERTGFPESRFEAESAVIVRAGRLGFRVTCVPVALGVVDGRATSHYRPLADSLRIAGAVIRARLEGRCGAPGRDRGGAVERSRAPGGSGLSGVITELAAEDFVSRIVNDTHLVNDERKG